MPIMYGTALANLLKGTSGDDVLYGLGGNDVLYGYAGNDSLIGGPGADRMYGGTGNDTYIVDSPNDQVIEAVGQGIDTVRTSTSYALPSNVENLVTTNALGTTSINLQGNDLANRIDGNAGANMISGGAGADRLYGGAGNDTLSGDGGRDVIHGGAGNDFISGNQWTGNDVLYGDAGADIFHFETFTSAQIAGYVPTTSATIMDFQTGVDKIDLHLFGISTNDHNLYWLGAGDFTGANRIEATFEGGVLQIDYNGDQVADLILNIPGTVAATDFTYTFDPWGY